MIPDNAAIADTVAAVFRGREYALHESVSLWDIIVRWLAQAVMRLFGLAAEHPAVGYVLRTTIIIAVVLIAVRTTYSFVVKRRSPGMTLSRRGQSQASDWWMTAQKLAAGGDYTAAAHALYMALVTAAALRGLVSLHDSKTTGDYLRELRRVASSTDVGQFADFTRSYETIIYGIGTCDSERFARLHTLAASILGPGNGSLAGAGA